MGGLDSRYRTFLSASASLESQRPLLARIVPRMRTVEESPVRTSMWPEGVETSSSTGPVTFKVRSNDPSAAARATAVVATSNRAAAKGANQMADGTRFGLNALLGFISSFFAQLKLSNKGSRFILHPLPVPAYSTRISPEPVCSSSRTPPPLTFPRNSPRPRVPWTAIGSPVETPPELVCASRSKANSDGRWMVISPEPLRRFHSPVGSPWARMSPLPVLKLNEQRMSRRSVLP